MREDCELKIRRYVQCCSRGWF